MSKSLEFEDFGQGQSAQSAELALLSDFDILNDNDFFLGEDFLNWKECDEPEEIKTILSTNTDIAKLNDIKDNSKKNKSDSTNTLNEYENNNSSLTQNKVKRDRSRIAYRLPKVPKNDIRRYFANMLMNTLNSGEFIHAQNFFQTFMTPTCRFSTTQILPAEVQLPLQVGGHGPAVFAHYFLGLHMMFPDIILTMTNPRVVTFGQSNCTRIVADLECNYTKTSHIPLDLWIPAENLLEELYAAQSLEEITKLLKGTSLEDTVQVSNKSEFDQNTIDGTNTGTTGNSSSSGNANTVCTAPITAAENTTSTENLCDHQQQQQTQTEGIEDSVLHKRKHSADTHTPASTSMDPPKTSSDAPTPAPCADGNRYIPMQFIGQLAQAAQPLSSPISLRTLGQMDIIMDENKHIVSMELRSHFVELIQK